MPINSNHSLPLEILGIVFRYLGQKESDQKTSYFSIKELKACTLVCKSWQPVAQKLVSGNMSIKVPITLLEQLLTDLPLFVHKVKYIRLCKSNLNTLPTDPERNVILWRDTVFMCPNLKEIGFDDTGLDKYIQALCNSEQNLKSIEHFYIHPNPTNPHLLLTRLCFRYCTRITSIDIQSLSQTYVNENCGNLETLVGRFPRLVRFKGFDDPNSREIIDLNLVLEAAPQLQVLGLSLISRIHFTKPMTDRLNLTYLSMIVYYMDFNSLRCIWTHLKSLQTLNVFVLSGLTSGTIRRVRGDDLFDELKTYDTSITKYNIVFTDGYGCLRKYRKFN